MVELEADEVQLVERWTEALQALLATGQSQLLQHGAAAATAAAGSQADREAAGEEAELVDAEAALQAMSEGEAFTLLTLSQEGYVQPISVRLSYAPPSSSSSSPSLGCVVWDEERVELDELTDVFLGPQSASFRTLPSSFPPPNASLCFSLLFASLQLDLVAAHEATLNSWLAGLNRILTRGGKSTVVQEEDAEEQQQTTDGEAPSGQGVRRHSRLSVRLSQQPQPREEVEQPATLSLTQRGGDEVEQGEADSAAGAGLTAVDCVGRMRLGSTLTRFALLDGRLQQQEGLLRYDEREEEEEEKAADAAQHPRLGRLLFVSPPLRLSLPLLALTDVYVGQQTRVWSAVASSQAPPSQLCFSLLSPDAEWDLQAPDEATLNLWLSGIHHILLSQPNLQLEEQQEGEEEDEERQPTSHEAAEAHEQRQQRGLHDEAREARGGREGVGGEERAAVAGSPTRGVESSKPLSAARVRQSFSIVPSLKAAPSSSSSPDGPGSASAAASFALLTKGEWFEQLPPSSSASARRVFVFLNPAASRAGCLYWTASSCAREERVGQSLALHTLTEVCAGAKSQAAWEGSSTTTDRHSAASCLSLMSRREKSSLHLAYTGGGGKRGGAADGERVVKAWVRAIRTVLHELGATVRGKEQPAAAAPRSAQQRAAAEADVASHAPSPSPAPGPASSPRALSSDVLALIAPLLRPCPMSLLTSTALYPVSLCLSTASTASPTLTYRHLSPGLSSSKPKRLKLRRVTDLYLGFSSPSLSSSGWADGAKVAATRAWSVVTRKAAWDLCADSEQERSSWVAALRHLILAVTCKQVVEEGEGEVEHAAALDEQPQPVVTSSTSCTSSPSSSAPRRLSFQPASAASVAPCPAASASSSRGAAALAALTSGLLFTRYEAVDGLTFRQPSLLFYRQTRVQGRPACDVLYWCDAAAAGVDRSAPPTSPSCCLAIDRITDIYLGKQTPLLQSAAATTPDAACIALISASLTLELEGTGEDTAADTLLEAVQFICTDGGRAMEEQKEQEALRGAAQGREEAEVKEAASATAGRRQAELAMLAKKGGRGKRFSLGPALQGQAVNRRLSVLSSRLSMLATHEDDAFELPAGASSSALLADGDVDASSLLQDWTRRSGCASLLSLMQEGRIFTGYTSDSRGRYHQSTLLLFLSLTPPTLHWCPYGLKQAHANASLPLASLASVQLGKLSPALSSPLARDAPAGRCFALHSLHAQQPQQPQQQTRSIELEARHERVLLAFLLGLYALLAQTGRALQQQGREGEGRRLLVVDLPSSRSPPPPAALAPSSLQPLPVVPAIPAPPPKRSLRSTGLLFELLLPLSSPLPPPTSSSSSSAHPRRAVLLFFSGDALHWTSPSSPLVPVPSQCLLLRSIRDIYCGKMAKQSKAGAQVAAFTASEEARCVSVVARAGVELHLLAVSCAEVRRFVTELMALLKDSGKTVCEDDDGKQGGGGQPSTPLAVSAASSLTTTVNAAAAPPPLPSRPAAAGSSKASSDAPLAAADGRGKENRTAPSRQLSVVAATRGPRRSQSALPSPAQSVQRMVEGSRFVLYSHDRGTGVGGVTARSVLLCYHPASHCLQLTAASPVAPVSSSSSAPSSPLLSVPVRQLVEVVLGKQTPLFLHSACTTVDRTRCVCLCVADGHSGQSQGQALQIHLQADSAAALSAWLADLQQLLSLQGKTVVVEANRGQPSSSSGAAGAAGGGGQQPQLGGAGGLDLSSRRFSVVNQPPMPTRAPTRVAAGSRVPSTAAAAAARSTPHPPPTAPVKGR